MGKAIQKWPLLTMNTQEQVEKMLTAVTKTANEWNIRNLRDFIESTERRLESMKRDLERAETTGTTLYNNDVDTILRQSSITLRDWHEAPSSAFGWDVYTKMRAAVEPEAS